MKVAHFDLGHGTGSALAPTIWASTTDLAAAPVSAAGVAWWIHDRHVPTVDEGTARINFMSANGPSPYAFAPSEHERPLTIDRVWLDDVDVQLLIAQLNADLYARYPEPGALVFRLDPADIVDGVGLLLMAEHKGRNIGCGAFRVIDDQPGTAEIKRMYVAPSARGHRIGAAILAELEQHAIALGIRRFVLEAGPRQPEAIQLYVRSGYAACEPWGEFIGKDLSVTMAKVVAEG